jgi:hypothetical protein
LHTTQESFTLGTTKFKESKALASAMRKREKKFETRFQQDRTEEDVRTRARTKTGQAL